MVGVIAAVGGGVEGDREPLLAAGEVGAVEGVGFLGGGEAGILAQRPGPAGVHGRLGPTGEGREAGQASKRLEALEVLRGVERLHRDAFGRVPDQAVRVGALQLARRQLAPVLQRSEEHTSELQSLMRNSYAAFCLKK